MGWIEERKTADGKVRYLARYRDARGVTQAAGIHATEPAATKALVRAEFLASENRLGDPRRGRQTFRRYVTQTWLPNHVIEASTREGYTYQLDGISCRGSA